jgi:putative methionine-R-sulfoxide reductase with GAF domain
MDQRSTLAQSESFAETITAAFPSLTDLLRFPAEDDGKSLANAAQRDLESALQLLAERARYVMGASGVAIALRDGQEMICRASAGPAAPPLETQVRVDSGLTAESIRKQQVLRCDDAESDRRVDQESCRALGVKSIMVTPLLRERRPIGVFELLAERSHAFEERDVTVLKRLSGMVLTALEQADAAEQAREEESATIVEEAEDLKPEVHARPSRAQEITSNVGLSTDLPAQIGQIQKCSICGFPVSATRDICLDCEKAEKAEAEAPAQVDEDSALLLSQDTTSESSWLLSGFSILAVMLTVAAILWLVFRLH